MPLSTHSCDLALLTTPEPIGIPADCAIALAIAGWSPVIMKTEIPELQAVEIASAMPSRMGSQKPINPRNPNFGSETSFSCRVRSCYYRRYSSRMLSGGANVALNGKAAMAQAA